MAHNDDRECGQKNKNLDLVVHHKYHNESILYGLEKLIIDCDKIMINPDNEEKIIFKEGNREQKVWLSRVIFLRYLARPSQSSL